jgi:hypothetical protein
VPTEKLFPLVLDLMASPFHLELELMVNLLLLAPTTQLAQMEKLFQGDLLQMENLWTPLRSILQIIKVFPCLLELMKMANLFLLVSPLLGKNSLLVRTILLEPMLEMLFPLLLLTVNPSTRMDRILLTKMVSPFLLESDLMESLLLLERDPTENLFLLELSIPLVLTDQRCLLR